jgi:hypothetical protein
LNYYKSKLYWSTIRNRIFLKCPRWKSTKGNERYVNQIKVSGNTLHFGDIFLADLRQYREEKLELMDLKVISALEHINYNLNSGIYQSRV